ncbi:MAG: hypothetical protein SGBAC_013480 [Bacillariaceae sp.]
MEDRLSFSQSTSGDEPSAFQNEDDSMMTDNQSINIMDSSRSLDSSYSADVSPSMNQLVDNLNDMDNQFDKLINAQLNRRVSTNSQSTHQDSNADLLRDELNGARLPSPSSSLLVETVDEGSCHESGVMKSSLRRMPSAESSLGNIQEEHEQGHQHQHQHQSSWASSTTQPEVETVDEDSCHESGLFSPNRRRSTDSSTNLSGISEENQQQQEFDPSVYKRKTEPHPDDDGYDTASSAGFSNSQGMGPSTQPQWDNLQSTLDQQTDHVRKSPYYNIPSDRSEEGPHSGQFDPDTDTLRRELDSAGLEPPTANGTSNDDDEAEEDVEAPRTNAYWQGGNKDYNEDYDDELLDVSLGGVNSQPAGGNNNMKSTKSSTKQLSNLVGNDSNYQLMVRLLGGCTVCMVIWTLVMIIVLVAK